MSRIVHKKNLHSAIQYFKAVDGDVTFDIYGPKEDLNYWEYCTAQIRDLPSNIKVNYCGVVSHDDVHRLFSSYDAFLFPTFSENYGHVIAEALQNECIPVISDNTPWSDINHYKAGWAINLEESEMFIKVIQELVMMDNLLIEKFRENIQYYIKEKMDLASLRDAYNDFLHKCINNNVSGQKRACKGSGLS